MKLKKNKCIRSVPISKMRPFERLLIIGCGGSGKSTLAAELERRTGLPAVYLDRLFWLSGWVQRNRTEFDSMLVDELNKPRWVIDGNYTRTLAQRLERCDAVLILDYPRMVCIAGIIRRRIQYAGRSRASITEGCPERLDPEFIRWVWSFRRHTLPGQLDLIRQAAQREHPPQIFILKNRSQARRWLNAAGDICAARQISAHQ